MTVTFLLALAGASLAVAASDARVPEPRSHVLTSGHVVELPPPGSLTCAEMRAVLARLDRSGYRGRGILPETHPDYPVFDYEDRLAAALYLRCTLAESRAASDTGAFPRGFIGD